jgi:hypothetical protein
MGHPGNERKIFMKMIALALLYFAFPLFAQNTSVTSSPDPWKPLAFLNGTWEAKTQGKAGVSAIGTYTFKPELKNHILARHSSSNSACKGPANFDCDHGDLLYVYQDGPGQPLKAIYFDNEGHVIHYGVSTPDPTTAVFLSEASQPGPQFRLIYELKGSIMSGKFQIHMPGQADWKSYLEWSGEKK